MNAAKDFAQLYDKIQEFCFLRSSFMVIFKRDFDTYYTKKEQQTDMFTMRSFR